MKNHPLKGYFCVGAAARMWASSGTGTLEPISAGFIAFVFIGEAIEPLQMVGGSLVIAAIFLFQFQREQDKLASALIRARLGRDLTKNTEKVDA
jgi:drug/metabolite transporter (DMT)-like permease